MKPMAPSNAVLVDRLYRESLELAEEARGYFAVHSKTDRQRLSAIDRLMYTCESLRISTRLMHVISWLMVRKAVANRELSEVEGLSPARRLGDPDLCRKTEVKDLRALPPMAASLSLRSQALYDRALRLQQVMLDAAAGGNGRAINPVATMLARLEAAY